MDVESERLEHALTHAKQILARQAQLPVQFSKGPDTLLHICKEYMAKNIELYAIDMVPDGVRAYYEATADGYNVYILEKQELPWRNFAACKELFHVLLDDPSTEDCRSVNLWGHVQDAVNMLLPLDGKPGPSTVIEFLAEVAAMEYLLPYAERVAMLTSGDNTAVPIYAAIVKLIPTAVLERYLSADWMEVLKALCA